MNENSRVALVGGGAGGIGAATAAALVESGHRSRRGPRPRSRGRARRDHAECDLADPAQAAELVAHVHERHGSLDVVVVNAGGPAPGELFDVTCAQWHRDLDLLLVGPLALLAAALPAMAGRGYGGSSWSPRRPSPAAAGLAASTVLRAAVTSA
ncbi:SDR family NAD(P)-dependent oxidoreductase [Lentzea guizhouensis]|uniref:SDR family NAD(P)-dependent oxidoreductase n=1 Tax=Lentzea guizhouensis TaxID=1586287 RepID=UPI0012B68554|nr:SDR family NAD(P)-dependent oxidoreductase [Lentzea guizhouensis]